MEAENIRKHIGDRLVGGGWSADRAEAVVRLVKPCVRLSTQAVPDQDIAVGATKLGGDPDLPREEEWPEDAGVMMNFIAQFDLRELSRYGGMDSLPSSGLLSFFYASAGERFGYDPEDFGAWRVVFSTEGLKRRSTPSDLARDNGLGPYLPCGVEYWPGYSAPGWESYQLESLGLMEDETEAFFKAWVPFAPGPQAHQINGCPFLIQGPMEEVCQTALPAKLGIEDWRILLQIRADENADMEWGDAGCLYFWIRQSDLDEHDFSKVWMVSQSH